LSITWPNAKPLGTMQNQSPGQSASCLSSAANIKAAHLVAASDSCRQLQAADAAQAGDVHTLTPHASFMCPACMHLSQGVCELAPSLHTTACVHLLHLLHNSTSCLRGGFSVWEAHLAAQTVYNRFCDVDLMQS